MSNKIKVINIYYKSTLSLLLLTFLGMSLLIFNVDPFTNYLSIYQFFIALAVFLTLLILSLLLTYKIKTSKELFFDQDLKKYIYNSVVFGSGLTLFLLLNFTGSLNTISLIIFGICGLGYYVFEFAK